MPIVAVVWWTIFSCFIDRKMIPNRLHVLIVLHFVLLSLPTNCERNRKAKRAKEAKSMPPKYEVYPSNQLPSDVQVTTYLDKGEKKTFFYTSKVDNGALSATIITCSGASIRWKMAYVPNNSTNDSKSLAIVDNMQTEQYPEARAGCYVLQTMAPDRATFVHIYISTEKGGPQALQTVRTPELRLLRRQRRRRLTVRWDPSLVDPQGTDYCLVVSTKRRFNSLCAAQTERYGKKPEPEEEEEEQEEEDEGDRTGGHLQIACVNRKTHYTVSDLKQGQNYFFSLFATNRQSNFTYPYGSTSTVFDGRVKPISLRDAKATHANLKKLDGKAVFRYKVGKKSGKSLDLFIMPCGGAIEVEISLKEKKVAAPKRIEGFGQISIPNPIEFGRYYIKVFATSREELKKTSGVEIYATTKNLAKIPLPNMPQEPTVTEYTSMRQCDSVTVGWIAAPSIQKPAEYCLVVKEGRIREMEDYKMPNQCGLENRLRKSADFAVEYCRNVRQEKEAVLTQKINKLKPGRSYIVQVTVKKPKGKTLSYDLLQVYTKPSCHHKNV